MREQLMIMVASFLAGSIIMVLHELPKAMIYQHNDKKNNKPHKNVYGIHHYIDPIGLLFCVLTRSGFSKPYLYRIREKKLNMTLAIAGYLSLVIQFFLSVIILRFGFGLDKTFVVVGPQNGWYEFFIYFFCCYAIISMGMLLSNLFPLMTNDMGLIIASLSPYKFFTVIRADYVIKMVWLFVVLLGLLNASSAAILSLFL